MKKPILLLILSLVVLASSKEACQAQIVNVLRSGESKVDSFNASPELPEPAKKENTVEWFEGGNIDYISGGLIQASARLFKINIGEVEKFYLPFYLLIGATTDISTDDDSPNNNEVTTTNLLSPNGGYLNMGIHGRTNPNYLSENTFFAITYQLGAKSISGNNAATNNNITMLSGIGNAGVFFQTPAWNPEDVDNLGIAWIQLTFASTLNDQEKIGQIYGEEVDNFFYGINIEGGVSVNKYINIRVGYYRYLNNNQIEDFSDGIFKFSADYDIN